ncbi:MAG: cytochrome c biogenesis protein CcsA [Planctomycetota bacterium]
MTIRSIALLPLMAVLLLIASQARGQYAPAGNAHPETQAVSDAHGGEGALPNPFGQPGSFSARPSLEDKHAFAQSIDLTPLAELAVLHNGRVKIMGTLAQETIDAIVGRHRYFEFSPPAEEGAKPEKRTFAPMFTLLDLVIDPAYYLDRPLVHVNYLPLRREVLARAFPEDELQQKRYMRLGRITPLMAQEFGPDIEREHEFEPAWREASGRVRTALALWQQSENNLLLVAPESSDDRWHHLAEPYVAERGEGAGAQAAALALGEAWRALDADAANAAIVELASALPAINSDMYPVGRASLEAWYNKLDAFEYGYWAYFVSLLALLLAFGTGRRWLLGTGVITLGLAILLHGAGFTLRCVIAERFAIQNQFESMTGISLFAAILGLGLAAWKKQWVFAAAAAGTGFLVLITATETAIPGVSIEREAAILNTSVLLKYHVTTVLVSYGLITLGFIVSLFYLGTHYASKLRKTPVSVSARASSGAAIDGASVGDGAGAFAAAAVSTDGVARPAGVQRTLKDLDSAQMVILQLAFWTLGVGILLGAWWADHSWGRWWAFDPKETWALITWIVYLIVIHLRFAATKNRGRTTAWLSVVGFVIMLWTYFGVNLLLPGLHAYA